MIVSIQISIWKSFFHQHMLVILFFWKYNDRKIGERSLSRKIFLTKFYTPNSILFEFNLEKLVKIDFYIEILKYF